MTLNDLYLLSPELSTAALAMLLLLVDLFVPRKGIVAAIGILGLGIPLALTIALWTGGGGVPDHSILAGAFTVDKFSLFFKFLFVSVAAAVALISNDYGTRFRKFQAEYLALMLFSVSGMMLLASASELVTVYISLELTALPVAALAAFLRNSRSSEAGMKFLILSGISSALLLYGMVLVYGFTGTTQLEEIAARLGEMTLGDDQPFGSYALLVATALIVAGFGFKITAVPFQMWAPDVYEGSPTPITAFLSIASKAAGFAVVLRVFYVAFPTESLSLEWSAIFAVIAAASMTVGNFVAIAQKNIKRMLAYSTVAHAGYILVGLASISHRAAEGHEFVGASGVLFYLAGYAAANLAAFSAVIAISSRIESDHIDDFSGMGRRAPYLAAALGFAMLSLTGIPPTVGFMVKIYIFGAALGSGLAWLAVVGVLNSVVSAYYYLRVIRVMYLGTSSGDEAVRPDLSLRVVLAATTAAIIVFGLYPGPLLKLARSAAAVLLSG